MSLNAFNPLDWFPRGVVFRQTFVAFIFCFGVFYYMYPIVYTETFVWQYTTLGEWIRPVHRNGCDLHKRTRSPRPEKRNLKIGLVMVYGMMENQGGENTWSDELMLPVLQNRKEYCEYHNYTMINAKDLVDTKRPISWSKLIAMDHHFATNKFDYLFYIDMDIVIMNFSIPLERFIEADNYEHDIILTHDWNGINFGVWLARNSAWTRWFLQTAWNQTQLIPPYASNGIKHPFDYEQRAVHYLLDTPAWKRSGLASYPGDSADIRKHFHTYPQCAFNSYTLHPLDLRGNRDSAQYKQGDFLVHFAGKRGWKKLKLMQHYLKKVDKTRRQ